MMHITNWTLLPYPLIKCLRYTSHVSDRLKMLWNTDTHNNELVSFRTEYYDVVFHWMFGIVFLLVGKALFPVFHSHQCIMGVRLHVVNEGQSSLITTEIYNISIMGRGRATRNTGQKLSIEQRRAFFLLVSVGRQRQMPTRRGHFGCNMN